MSKLTNGFEICRDRFLVLPKPVMAVVVAIGLFVAIGAGRVTGATDGVPVIGKKVYTTTVIVTDKDGSPVVWQDADGRVHGHIIRRGWWITRVILGDFYTEAAVIDMTPEQVVVQLEAEAVTAQARAEKAAKDAEQAAAKLKKE